MHYILQKPFIVSLVIIALLHVNSQREAFGRAMAIGGQSDVATDHKTRAGAPTGRVIIAQFSKNNFGNGPAFRRGKKFRKGKKSRKKRKIQMKALHQRGVRAFEQGQYAKAERLYLKILTLKKRRFGATHWKTAVTMTRLSVISFKLGRFQKALSYARNSLAIKKRALRAGDKKLAQSYHVLAATYNHLGRYRESEKIARIALKINLKAHGKFHKMTAKSYFFMGFSQILQGKYIEAENNLSRSLEIYEKTVGPSHPETARTLRRFADLFQILNRPEDALPLYKRSLAIRIKVLGAKHPDTGRSHFSIAEPYRRLGRFREAETHLKQAIKIHSRTLGKTHQYNNLNIDGLAKLYRKQERYEDAVQLLEKSYRLRRKTLGVFHAQTAHGQFLLAGLYLLQGQYEKAAQTYKSAMIGLIKVWGRDHVLVTRARLGLGRTYLGQNRFEEAYELLEQVSNSYSQRGEAGANGLKATSQSRAKRRGAHVSLVVAAWRLAKQDPARKKELRAKAFIAAQRAKRTTASAAVAKMSARFGAGSGPIAKLAREGQDFSARWQTLNSQLLVALGVSDKQRNKNLIKSLRIELSNINEKLSSIDQRLAKDFPRFTALAKGRELSIADVKAQLGPREALVFYLSTKKNTFVWLVTKTKVKWLALGISRRGFARRVSHLRKGLDIYAGIDRSFIPEKANSNNDDIRPYDLNAAHKLYTKLLGGVEDLTSAQDHLVIVADGPLTAFPFHALVKTAPDANIPIQDRYQKADWLVRHFATTILPSVSSLKALRDIAGKNTPATKTMIGFGDPVFNRATTDTAKNTARGYASYFRGARANLGALSALQRLPGTRAELVKIARTLNVDRKDLKLGVDASERTVKATKLDDYRIVYFATHGLVAGDIEGLAEPALALTVPHKASAIDDGLLTASEVATLKLNADWLIMSACNTAAGDKPGAEALSGLARAFFYAGAKTLLVSHWPVDDGAAVILTTKAFKIIDDTQKAGQVVGRAQALRGSMLSMINAGGPYTHPTFWAPFIVVGEGAAR